MSKTEQDRAIVIIKC